MTTEHNHSDELLPAKSNANRTRRSTNPLVSNSILMSLICAMGLSFLILKSNPILARNFEYSESVAPIQTDLVNVQTTDSTKSKFRTELYFRLLKPIPSFIGPTVISSGDPFNQSGTYKISTLGYGLGIQRRVHKNIGLHLDVTNYFFKQKLVNPGETANVLIGAGFQGYPFPLGVKYVTNTTAIRMGAKYIYSKSQTFQPWIGVGYGVNIWTAKYLDMDEEKVYGKAAGNTFRASISIGLDMRVEEIGMLGFFFEAISPVAVFTMENLFGLGDYHQFDATTFPTPRIGMTISVF